MAASTCRPQPLVCVAFATSDQPHLQNTQEDTQEVTGTKENYFMQKKKKKKNFKMSLKIQYLHHVLHVQPAVKLVETPSS